MNESKSKEISRFLQDGLDHYGLGEVADAILTWKRVLELDPENPEAMDYIRTADRRRYPRPEPSRQAREAQNEAVAAAHSLLDRRQFEEALELLTRAAHGKQFDLELESTIDLVRSCLHKEYRDTVGDLSVVPQLTTNPKDLTRYNLPSDAGFLLSMIDGVTSLESLISLSGMDAFTALRTTRSLIEAGIVRMDA